MWTGFHSLIAVGSAILGVVTVALKASSGGEMSLHVYQAVGSATDRKVGEYNAKV